MEIDYRKPGAVDFSSTLELVRQRLVSDAFTVELTESLPVTSAAEFNGLKFYLQASMAPDARLFNLLHLFGHTVQWCTNADHRLLARRVIVPGQPLSELELLAIALYEQEASELGLQLLHEVGTVNLDQWLSDVWAWDWDYLKGVYVRNAPAQPALSYDYSEIPFGRTRLRPCPIPPFTLQQFDVGRVI